MSTTTAAVTALPTSHWFSGEKEEIWFVVSLTLPRVGAIEARFKADRYIATVWHDNGPATKEWVAWRIYRDYHQKLLGVGPKTLDTLRAIAEPVIMEWLNGPEYGPSRSKAVSEYIRNLATEAQGGYALYSAREALSKHQDDLSDDEINRIAKGINLLEEGYKIMREEA